MIPRTHPTTSSHKPIPSHRELEGLKARSGNESWVPNSIMYKLVQQQLAESASQLEGRNKALAVLQHEKDELLRQLEGKNQMAEVGCVVLCVMLQCLFWGGWGWVGGGGGIVCCLDGGCQGVHVCRPETLTILFE